MSKDKLKQIQGTSPLLVSGESLFEWLVDDSENNVNDHIRDTIFSLENILVYGGDKTEATAEFIYDQSAPPDKVFEVLSLDVAIVFPEDFDTKNEKIFGRQFWLCRTNENSDEIWYARALKNYFDTPPGGSLLNYPEVQKNRELWHLSFPPADASRQINDKVSQDKKEPKIWKGAFTPDLFENSSTKFNERFKQFGASVFGELGEISGALELSSCSLLWIYVGLSEEEKPNRHQNQTAAGRNKAAGLSKRQKAKKSPWGISLFAVIKPVNVPTDCEHWTENAKMSSSLLKAIDKLYLYLEAEGYKSIQKRRLEKEKKASELNTGQAIAHEFKNLTHEVSVLGNNIRNKFKNLSTTARHRLEADSEIRRQISELTEDLTRLSRAASFLTPISLASYWLANADQDSEIEFLDDDNCKLFQAAAYFALDLCKGTKSDWTVEDYDLEESISVIKEFYNVENVVDLADRIDFALLLFVLNEPIRNIRSENTERKGVNIKIRSKGNSLYLCQETLESEETFEPIPSPAVKRVNKLLRDAEGLSQSFVHISEETKTKSCVKQKDGLFEVNRETEIKVFKIPLQK